MFLEDLFSFANVRTCGTNTTADIQINPDHSLFKGHFPGRPILPGVCMIQIVKALIEISLGKKTKLIQAREVKFLSFILPGHCKYIKIQMTIKVDSKKLVVDAKLSDELTLVFKFRGSFTTD
jgi:3-hydroxyacyl-[acyl-carrier-protein] dehydratase